MKNLKNKSLKLAVAITALLIAQSFVGFSQSNISLNVANPDRQIAKLKIESILQEEPLRVTIKNSQGIILFKGNSEGSNYLRWLDFSKLNQGTYTVDVAHAKGVSRKVLVKGPAGLSVEEGTYYFNNSVEYKQEDKKLLVTFNNNINEAVTVRITDDRGNILVEQAGIRSANYATLFNLSKLTSGTYSMSLTSGDFTNTKSLQL